MTAVVAGVTVAIIWTIATIASARASRVAGPTQALAGVMVVGLVACVPLLLVAPPGPTDLGPHLPWLLVAGGANLVGLLLNYAAMTRGNVSIVAPIAATEGAIAATIAIVVGGEPVTAVLALALGVVVAKGVVLTAWGPEGGDASEGRPGVRCSWPRRSAHGPVRDEPVRGGPYEASPCPAHGSWSRVASCQDRVRGAAAAAHGSSAAASRGAAAGGPVRPRRGRPGSASHGARGSPSR
ncbi:MAG: DMT family transporter [Chloroflexota bacterium]